MSNRRATGISVMRLRVSPDDSFPLLKQLGELLAQALQDQPKNLGLLLPGADARTAPKLAEATLLATHAQCFRMPKFTSKADKRKPLKRLRLIGLPERLDLGACEAAARAQNLARWLTALPPNLLNVAGYRQIIDQMAATHGWQQEFYDEKRLAKLGAGAFMAVSQGNAGRDAGIVKLSYRPDGAKAGKDATALVGKGILFDTGGNNLKPHKSMLDMHEDMAGSAVALATLLALSETGYPRPVDCWLAITENRIGAKAYKPRDVVTACNGKSIEIIHTDAEGRMVLADTLALAGRDKPRLILDYATLTGACVYALTERYSGVFANRDGLGPLLIDAGRRSGERVWPFPMDADFDEALKSKRADILQCSTDGSGDHILAARFLQRFVPKESAWIHMDLSAASRSGGLGQVPGGATGFGVRLSLELLQNQSVALDQCIDRS
jgi:leucyl aminopeptidase